MKNPTDDGDGGVNRREFITGTAAAGLFTLAGCAVPDNPGTEFRAKQITESRRIQITEIYVNHEFGTESGVFVDLDPIANADSLLWMSPEGEQIAARKIPYGAVDEYLLRTEAHIDSDKIEGTNELVAVAGGEIDCHSGVCEQFGGNRITEVRFEVIRE